MSDRNEIFEGLQPSRPAPELRARVLAAARSAAGAARPSAWDLLWESRPLRLGWALGVAALLMGHVLLGRPSPGGRPGPRGAGLEPEVAEVLDLPPMPSTPSIAEPIAEEPSVGSRNARRQAGAEP